MIRAGGNAPVGVKRTMKFHQYTGDDALSLSVTKTNWIMNVCYTLKGFIKVCKMGVAVTNS